MRILIMVLFSNVLFDNGGLWISHILLPYMKLVHVHNVACTFTCTHICSCCMLFEIIIIIIIITVLCPSIMYRYMYTVSDYLFVFT